jgi:hypothetical protein
MAKLDGERVLWSFEVRLNCNATLGRTARRSGYVEATQEELYRVATAPIDTGAAEAFVCEQV